jgi:flagellar motor switch protein FliM
VPTEHLSQAEIDAAVQVRMNELNVQSQPRVTWPANFITARAYVDQLVRTKAFTEDRAKALRTAMDRADRTNAPRADIDAVDTLAAQIEKDAASARGIDAERMKSLAATIKGRVSRLR